MTELICKFIDFILELSSMILPDIAFATDLFSNFGKYMELGLDLLIKVNFLIPVPLIISILFIQLMLRIAYIAFYIVNWVIKRIFDVIP